MNYIDTIKNFFPGAERQSLVKKGNEVNLEPYISYSSVGPGYMVNINFYTNRKPTDSMVVEYDVFVRGNLEHKSTSTAEDLPKKLAYIKGLALGLVMNTENMINQFD